jgi:hypothetical protein
MMAAVTLKSHSMHSLAEISCPIVMKPSAVGSPSGAVEVSSPVRGRGGDGAREFSAASP